MITVILKIQHPGGYEENLPLTQLALAQHEQHSWIESLF